MVNITDLLIACTQAPGETGPITLVTFCVQIVTEDGMFSEILMVSIFLSFFGIVL